MVPIFLTFEGNNIFVSSINSFSLFGYIVNKIKKNEIKSNCIDWVIVVCGGDGDYGCLVSHCCFS